MLCWTVREIEMRTIELTKARLDAGLARKYAQPDAEKQAEAGGVTALARTQGTLLQANQDLPALSGKLPRAVVPFYDRLRETIAAKQRVVDLGTSPLQSRLEVTYEAIASAFALESFPAVRAYVDAAKADARSCPDY